MNITIPTNYPVPQLYGQSDVPQSNQPPVPPGNKTAGHVNEPYTDPNDFAHTEQPAAETSQQSLVRNKRGIFNGFRRPSLPSFPSGSGSRVPHTPSPPGTSVPGGRVPKPEVNDAATKLQAALGAKKTAPSPANGASQPVVAGGSSSAADKFKALASQAKETNAAAAGGPVLVKVADQAPISVADVTKRLLDADRLVKSGVISTSPSASKVALDSFINAGVSGLVSAPINVGAYAGSVATGEAIKSQYTPATLPPPHLPGAAKPPLAQVSVPTGAVAEMATPPAASTTRRLDRVEAAVLKFANVLLTLATGVAGDGVGKDENWPKERGARLTNLERLLDVSEQQMKQVAEDNGVLFKPYVVLQDVSGKSGGRVGAIEQRYRAMEKAVDQIIILKGAEAKRAGTAV